MGGFGTALGLSFHLVLSDGHNQLQGQSRHVANEVIEIFRSMGVDVTWSSDASAEPSTERPTVVVAILPHSSRDWRVGEGAMAAVARNGPASPGSVFVFYPDVARVMNSRPARTSSILDGRPPGVPWSVGVARVVAHEILYYFLPGRPHDSEGLFMEHQRGDSLLSSNLEMSSETRDAFLAKLRELNSDPC